jgi:hypothetical protein
MIYLGPIEFEQDEIEYSNENVKIKINQQEFERGELILTKK